MKKGPDITITLKQFTKAIARYQTIIFFILISLLIGLAVVMILRLFATQADETAQGSTPLISAQNKETVEAVGQLQDSKAVDDIPAPTGRVSPFFESTWDKEIMKL